MKQDFNIIRIETSMDMGIGDRTKSWESVSGDDLVAGKVYEIHGSQLTVNSIDKDEPRGMGFCFNYWSAKRAALARRGIQWRSPSAMNPRVMFD